MSQLHESYATAVVSAAQASAVERRAFLRKTYLHLLGAVLAFVAIEAALLQSGAAESIARNMTGGMSWLIVLGAFMLVSWLAHSLAHSAVSPVAQYLGLGLYVGVQAVITLPLLYVATRYGGPGVIPTAGFATAFVFIGLTLAIFTTGSDFSFLRPVLVLVSFAALAVIVCAMLFGFSLGVLFTVLMVIVASGWILYDTSQVMHHYHTRQHVAAALALFASLALLFWYMLRLVMYLQSRD